MTYKPSMKLELNNTHFPKWNSITLKQALNQLSGITINMPNPAGQYTTLPFEDLPIKFYLGWDTSNPPLRFDGSMDDPSFSIQKSGANISMFGRDFGKALFHEATVDDDFNAYGNPITNGYILDYIRYINQHLTSPIPELFARNVVDDANSLFEYMFSYNKSLEALKTLASYGNYEWLMALDQDNNRQFILRPPKALIDSNVTHAFIVGNEDKYSDIPSQATIHNAEQVNVQKQYGFKKNYIKVIGANGIEAVYPLSPPSNPKHLLHTDESLLTEIDTQSVAQRLWASKSAPKILVDFSGVGVETLRVGDIIYVNDYRYGASTLPSHLFRLIGINDTLSFGSGWKSTFKVADFSPSLFQFFDGSIAL